MITKTLTSGRQVLVGRLDSCWPTHTSAWVPAQQRAPRAKVGKWVWGGKL